MAIQKVSKFKLNQQGGYVCRTEFVYMDSNGQTTQSKQTDNELLGQSYTTSPGSLGVPDGSTVWMKIWVMAGNDNQASQAFIYDSSSSLTAEYTCSGTTLANHLALDEVN